jgi:HD-like signal output (HDOD) protein
MSAPVVPDTTAIVARALASVGEIATLPEITAKIIELVENPRSTARDLHQIIKNDPALSARILKVVNSAFYGLPGQIATVDRAIIMLGLSAVKNIAIVASITRLFRTSKLGGKFTARDLWTHSLAVAAASRLILTALGGPGAEEAFLAGLIHDLGVLIERQAFADKLAEVIAQAQHGVDFCQAEQQIIGAMHENFGQALTAKWKFPRHLRVVTGYHHQPWRLAPEHRRLTAAVHVADWLSCQQKHGFYLTGGTGQLPQELLLEIGLSSEQLDQIAQQLPEQLGVAESMFSSA